MVSFDMEKFFSLELKKGILIGIFFKIFDLGNGTKTPTVNTSEVATDTANEPIYESVIPREDGSNSPPPLPTPPHKLRPKSPGVDRIQRNTTERSTSPRPRQPGSPQCGSRPSSRGSSTVSVFLNQKKELDQKLKLCYFTISLGGANMEILS